MEGQIAWCSRERETVRDRRGQLEREKDSLREKKMEEIVASSIRLLDCSTQADGWGASAALRGWRWLQKDSPMATLLATLGNLKRPMIHWDDLLVYIISQKFSARTRSVNGIFNVLRIWSCRLIKIFTSFLLFESVV